MWCSACGDETNRWLCGRCEAGCRPSPERVVDGMLVRPRFLHVGAARQLVHELKFRGSALAGRELATAMVALVPPDVSCLVPIPRVQARRWRYGVDPAFELARSLGAMCGIRVVPALAGAVWSRPHTGAPRVRRHTASFRRVRATDGGAMLVDDVITTGATLGVAARALSAKPLGALTATNALAVTSLRRTIESGGTHL